MIGILIGGLVVFLAGRWYIKAIERLKSVRLVNPADANGRPETIPYIDPLVTLYRMVRRVVTRDPTTDFELFPKFAKAFDNKSHSAQLIFFGVPIIMTWDAQAIREISSNTEVFHKTGNVNVLLDRLAGEGVLMVDGDRWSRQRRVMNPSFRITKLKSIFPAFTHTGRLLVNAIKEEMNQNNGNVKIYPLLTKMTMEAIGKAGFGFDFGSFDKNAPLELQSYQYITERLADPKSFIAFMSKLPTRENKKLDESFTSFRKLVTSLIEKKRAQPKNEGEESDLLEMLVSANDEGSKMTDEELIHNVNTFFIAGHETSSSGLTNTLYMLAKNIDAQEKARAEVKQILHGADPTYEDIAHLNYITAVIREAMRILPPLLGFSRQAMEDCTVNGYHVPKGTLFSMLSVALHNSEEFYDEPSKFKPERWLKENENEKPNSAPWYPFGAGPRMCIGNHFAMLEMKAVLAMLLQQFKFTPKGELKFQRAITLKPFDSFTLGVETL
eukprot:TRINITY_DN1670_c0_g1_i2.p1 TRINITY_DN1670_c0_g1~~TRINITY_DN1670_c0_g1_i2.p1  ORF type:complete len:497 (-),score=95.65 TRINITY_DN1670_c0_g1_i2:25-1515(-)